jgi:formylglycine-generating enzyme required for sulfatase activity
VLVVSCVAVAGWGGAQGSGVTGTAVQTRFASASVVRVGAGEFVMGASLEDVRTRAPNLCRREVARLAERVGAAPSDEPLELRARYFLRGCVGIVTPEEPCNAALFESELDAHPVWLAAYGIDRTEVTVGEYARCVTEGGCRQAMVTVGTPLYGDARQPVVGVSWDDARDYCAWRGARLPTEAEWERAARGRDERPFPWGWQWDPRRANHGALQASCRSEEDGWALTAPVGSFPTGASPEGALDMAGNAMEWVADRSPTPDLAPYSSVSAVAPAGPAFGGHHVVRGGGWNVGPFAQRTTFRMAFPSAARERYLGFRCAWDTW